MMNMRAVIVAPLMFLICSSHLGSAALGKEKPTIYFQQMAEGMRDAFNCGVIVEEYRHGPLKGKDDQYQKLRKENNCEYVESVLNALPDQR